MKLSTIIPLQPLKPKLDYSSRVVLLGSCFTENIGSKLGYYGFHTTVNPFGIVFNPVSLALLLSRSLNDAEFTTSDVQGHFSYLAHSDLNATSSDEVVSKLNNAANALTTSIKNASHVIITLGTAWIYELKTTTSVIANCHKQAQDLFNKRLLDLKEITTALDSLHAIIKKVNTKSTITYTLSPVRHLKDGFVENQRSKSRLHECIQQQIDQQQGVYFPAYEIVMDELRDYRYYDRDMLHLNDLGIDFVWERFRESAINSSTQHAMEAMEKYQQLKAHRPQDKVKHDGQVQKMKEYLLKTYPNITHNKDVI
jgi:hypothetical protein